MTSSINLKELSDISTPDRSFLTLYLKPPFSLNNLQKRFLKARMALKSDPEAKDEREFFDENVKLVTDYFKPNPPTSGAICIFACWAIDYFKVYQMPALAKDILWIDSSPYIRPLAELQDEYENVAVVIADNKKARIFLVSSAVAGEEKVIKGNIKNHVKKGGWSQQRYERRRDKQLQLYAREIVEAIAALNKDESFKRIIMVGGKETLRVLFKNLPPSLQKKTDKNAIDLNREENMINREIMELYTQQERRSEHTLWEKIRAEYLKDGLGVVGIENVLNAVKIGQVDTLIVHRSYTPTGQRCRSCEHLQTDEKEKCSHCGSESVFAVDLVNEIVEMLMLTGGEIEFSDPIETLTEAGNIAAFLRYKL